ncbi:Holliday junction branch migration DNA helicase RuvB [bacterium]|nr:Holliday junction branch migration DNA helicase RuvB [bacterium]
MKPSPIQSQPGDISIDRGIRPDKFDEIIGRKKEKQAVQMMIKGAKSRGDSLDHILFYGPPGLGKTTFAMAIASELGSSLRVTSGPAIERQGDLAAILTNLKANDILFVDEIHRLSRAVEEVLYPAMEDRVIDIVMGKGPSAKTIRLSLEPFTLIGATTQIGKISSPMRDRFGLIQRLDYFDDQDLKLILVRAADVWGIEYDEIGLDEIAKRARGTARIALRLLKRVRDFTQGKRIDLSESRKALELLNVDDQGLEAIDRKIISMMYQHFNGGPVGLSTLAASLSEDVDTISEVYEPFLMKCGFIKRTSRGRVLTESGIKRAVEILGISSII